MENTEVTYLLMVAPFGYKGHNKYYKMIKNGATWTAEYGRVGATPQRIVYPISVWNKKYDEKIAKGYIDRSELHQDVVKTATTSGYKDIDDASVSKIVEKLQLWANATIKKSYTISSKEVTELMVEEAQKKIDLLSSIFTDVRTFNDILLELFTIIPRTMPVVDVCMAQTTSDFEKIVRREQDLLDVMRGQVGISVAKKTSGLIQENLTILQAIGLDMRECTENEMKEIKKHIDPESRKLVKNAWKVKNKKTDEKFNEYIKKNNIDKVKFFYHGSRNENLWNILSTGLLLHPNAIITGKMFGKGLYFAPKASKSINYTSIDGAYYSKGNARTGLLAVFKVAVGKQMDVKYFENKYTTFTEKDMIRNHCNSLYAHKGNGNRYDAQGRRTLLNDEVIVYNESAATVQYLIELERG